MLDLLHQRVIVLGLGLSGLEAARLLREKGAQVTVRDDAVENPRLAARAGELRALGIRVELGGEGTRNDSFDLAVLSPGIPPHVPLVDSLREQGVPILSELELASRFCACPIVAITGTNGKTTTTELVQALFSAAGLRTLASGNIGIPFSAAVRQSAELDFMVLEVSSFQLEEISDFRPHVSVHLNLTPDHLDRYPSMCEYKIAKWRIFRNQTSADFALVNAGLVLPAIAAQKITFSAAGLAADYQLLDGWLVARGEQVLPQDTTRLFGRHNAENMLAALAVADVCRVPRAAAIEAFRAYRLLPHRCENVGEIGGAVYLNDSKATNIDALEKALLSMTTPVVLIAGGKDKGLDFSGLLPLLREKVRQVVLIGQMAPKLTAAWGGDVPCVTAATLAEAFARARAFARPGDTVLFSPGCSSYDMFKSFEDRGDQFRRLVQGHLAQPALST